MIKRRLNGNRHEIFDSIRKKWVKETNEESVRQYFIHYLIDVQNIPPHFISVERQISYLGHLKRYDIVIYKKNTEIFMVIECKASSVELSQATINQAAVYNTGLNAEYIGVTNGKQSLYIQLDTSQETPFFTTHFPAYNQSSKYKI